MNVCDMWCVFKMELVVRSVRQSIKGVLMTYGQDPLAEYDKVYINRFEICRTIRILVECAVGDEVVMLEDLDLFACFLHENVFYRKRVNGECLAELIRDT